MYSAISMLFVAFNLSNFLFLDSIYKFHISVFEITNCKTTNYKILGKTTNLQIYDILLNIKVSALTILIFY